MNAIELWIASPATPDPRTVRLNLTPVFFTILLALGACDHGPSGGSFGSGAGGSNWGGPGTGGGGGGTSPELAFDGPISATPSTPTSVALEWHTASVVNATAAPIQYDVFRAESADMSGEVLITSLTDATSFDDPGLTDGKTYFYRILAHTTDLASDNADVVSAHLPTIPSLGIDYATTIEPLWSTLDRTGQYTCLECHNGVDSKLDLTSFEGLMAGVGSAAYPDSFIIPSLGEDSFKDAIARIRTYPKALPAHKAWKQSAALFEANLIPWINEGAHQTPDTTPPTFMEADFADPEKFSIEVFNAERFKLRFPHAYDPESTPYINNTPGDHLEYRIYGGMDSNSIDWENPLRVVKRLYFPHWKPKYEITVLWPHDEGVFVVRAVDFRGNQSLEEAELVISRPK